MRYRELKLKPIAGCQEGEARVFRLDNGGAVAVLRSGLDHEAFDGVASDLIQRGFVGTIVALRPGEEFTLCEVEDSAPVRWQEDGRPSYVELEAEVKKLQAQVAMGSGADCMPCVVTR